MDAFTCPGVWLAQTGGEWLPETLVPNALVPAVIALIVFWVGVRLQINGKPKWIKWLALIPLLFAVYSAIEPTRAFYTDEGYKALYGGTWKKGMLHALGIIVGVLEAAGFAIWARRLSQERLDEF